MLSRQYLRTATMLCLWAVAVPIALFAQPKDSLQILQWHEQCISSLQRNEVERAIEIAGKAEAKAEIHGWEHLRGKSLYFSAKAFAASNNFSSSLSYYLQAIHALEKSKDTQILPNCYESLGMLYLKKGIYPKAVAYFEQSLQLAPSIASETGLADAYLYAEALPQAKNAFLQLLPEQANDAEALGHSYGQLAFIAQQAALYDEALSYSKKRLEAYQKAGNLAQIGNTLNNMGYLYQRKGDQAQALAHFEQAKNAFSQIKQTQDLAVLTNMGVVYAHLGDHAQAQKSYRSALELAQQQGNAKEQAKALNYLAASLYIAGQTESAIAQLSQAVAIAEKNKDLPVLAESYRIYSEIYRREEQFKESQLYDKRYQSVQEALDKATAQKKQNSLEALLAAEKQENEYRALIADKERQTLSLRQLSLEKEKLELEKSTLEKEQESLRSKQELQEANLRNERLERERVNQALELAQKQLDAEHQRQTIANLQAEQERQRMELAQKELQEKERQQAIELLESEKALQDERLAKEGALRRMSYWLFALFAVIFAIIAFSFVQQRKASRKLKMQALEITQKNEELLATEEELRQNMEELETTQENLKTQKEQLEVAFGQLEVQNLALTSSIRYAETIQATILPSPAQLSESFAEHLVIYLPKDVVSGDFYWMSKQNAYTFIAVADCTGHGVPGAFMSMIGSSLLNQFVNEKRMTDTANILNALNRGIIASLKQKDSNNTDGMDISLCRLAKKDDSTFEIHYSGAKSKLLWIDGETGELQEAKSDNLPIGGIQRKANASFSAQAFLLKPGDIVYLTTDGYIDMANAQRKRLGTPKLMETIRSIYRLPLAEQHTHLLRTLKEHQGDEPQRDDITLLAFKL